MLGIALYLIIFLVGLLMGSFLNVCIYRIPNEESINFPPSHCQKCKHRLGVLDLIPILSYIGLRGKCRYCGEKISMQYLCIELFNGLAYLYCYYHFGLSIEMVLACLFVSVAIVLTLIDWRHMILPTGIIMFGSIGALIIKVLLSFVHHDPRILINSVLGGLLGYGVVATIFYMAIKLFKKEGMGYGDVRYLGMIGLYTSPSLVFLTLLIACIIGSVYGIFLYLRNKESVAFPFGPFLSVGAVLSLFYGESLMSWYIGLWM